MEDDRNIFINIGLPNFLSYMAAYGTQFCEKEREAAKVDCKNLGTLKTQDQKLFCIIVKEKCLIMKKSKLDIAEGINLMVKYTYFSD